MSDRGYPMVVITQSEEDGGGFIAYAPDLHGCMADGDTAEAALADLSNAIEEWIDEAKRMEREIPAPGHVAERAHQERAEIKRVLEAQSNLISKQDELLQKAREEIKKIKEGLATFGEDDVRGEKFYLTWGGMATASNLTGGRRDRKNTNLPH